MADAKLIDGKAFALSLRQRVGAGVADLVGKGGPKPGLATVLVGADPASQVYVRSKGKQAVELGMASFDRKLPAETTEQELLSVIAGLNADPAVNSSAERRAPGWARSWIVTPSLVRRRKVGSLSG